MVADTSCRLTGLDKVSVGNTLGPSVVELNSYRRQHTAVINNHGGAPKVRLRMIVRSKAPLDALRIADTHGAYRSRFSIQSLRKL